MLACVSTEGDVGVIATKIVPAANTFRPALAALLVSATAVTFKVTSGGTGTVLGAV